MSITYLSMPVETGVTYYFQAGVFDEYFAGAYVVEFESLTFGDTDCTESMDTLDALAVLRFAAGLITDEEEFECVEYGDINCDGRLDSLDALTVLRMLAGLSVTVREVCASGQSGFRAAP